MIKTALRKGFRGAEGKPATIPLIQTMATHWDLIGDLVQRAQRDVGATRIGRLNRKVLGRGAFGAVLRVGGGHWVCKVTTDIVEGPIVAAIMSDPVLRWHPGFPVFAGVWRINTPEHARWADHVYVIVREDVGARKCESKGVDTILGHVAWALEHLEWANKDVRLAEELVNEDETPWRLARLEEARGKQASAAATVANELLDARQLHCVRSISNVVDAVSLLWTRHGLLAFDLHMGNVGHRGNIAEVLPDLALTHTPGQLVFHDLGGAEPGAPELLQYHVAALANSNPAVAELLLNPAR